jgi:beta-lactamase regulating signal transducer with metallopeptidase domain
MIETLTQIIASNLLVSATIAAVAWLIQSRQRHAALAHMLWMIALIKLLTPPLFTLPIVPVSTMNAATTTLTDGLTTAVSTDALTEVAASGWQLDMLSILGLAWLIGSVGFLLWSLLRVTRFQRLLYSSSTAATPALAAELTALCDRFQLARTPTLRLTNARITPLVWWLGKRPHIYLPAAMIDELKHEELRWILAHELGHVSRGDHYVRWIEWLACVAFWWNPVAWWARRNLRQNEEICCDALVLRTLQGSRHSYANSLLQAVEFLTEQGPRPPAMASEINSGGFLKRRFEMIVSKTPLQASSRWLRLTAVAFAAWLLPLGVAYAQNPDVRAVAERLERAVKAGEMSKDQMDAVLRMLKQPQGRANKDNKVKKRRDASPDVQKMIDDTRRRVRELVEAGEMTRAEAGEAMEKRIAAIKKRAGSAASKQRDDGIEQRIEEVKRRMRAAVESGDMSPEEARKATRERIATIQDYAKKAKGNAKSDRGAMEKMKAEHENLVRELTEMVKAGKLSREDMERKVIAHRRGIAKKMERTEKKRGKQTKGTPDQRWQRLEQAVKNGDMTEEEAKQKYAEWQKDAKAKPSTDKKNQSKRKRSAKGSIDPEAMRARLGEAVERGVMTKEQAKQRWEAFRKEMATEEEGGKQKAAGKRKRRTSKRDGDR